MSEDGGGVNLRTLLIELEFLRSLLVNNQDLVWGNGYKYLMLLMVGLFLFTV